MTRAQRIPSWANCWFGSLRCFGWLSRIRLRREADEELKTQRHCPMKKTQDASILPPERNADDCLDAAGDRERCSSAACEVEFSCIRRKKALGFGILRALPSHPFRKKRGKDGAPGGETDPV